MTLERIFARRSRWVRVAPFAVVAVAVLVLVPFDAPDDLGLELAAAGLLLVATLLAAALVPLGSRSSLVAAVPILLFLASVAVLRDAYGGHASGYGSLVLVPVIWVAVFGGPLLLAATVLAGGLTIALPTAIAGAPEYPASELRRAILLAFIAAATGWLVHTLIGFAESEMRRRRAAELALARIRASQIHDDIVQNLTAAQLALALGDPDAVERGVTRALEGAREAVAKLMAEGGPVEPGSLRRVDESSETQPRP